MATLELHKQDLPERIAAWVAERRELYPTARALLIPALMECQKHYGCVPTEAALAVAELLGVPYPEVESVISFYTMLLEKPLGKYVVALCCTYNCELGGAKPLFQHYTDAYGPLGEVCADGLLTCLSVECLCDCHNAPSAQVLKAGREFKVWWLNNLTPEIFKTVLAELKTKGDAALRERLVRIDTKANPPDERQWVWLVTTRNQYPCVVNADGTLVDALGKLGDYAKENPELALEIAKALTEGKKNG
jgi:NADH-quinone oxidoreductase subunit E